MKQNIWASLRNTAEVGVAHGALEFFLKSESDNGRVMPASLLVSMVPTRGQTPICPEELAKALAERKGTANISTFALPAGEAVHVLGATNLDFHVHIPGGVGYLVLSFSVPLSGMGGALGRLCEAIAQSLRWVM
ncbi:hypothetical protein [Streptomyces sp. 7N604]|uniref:hypothetical protein n=1 Tax=Streptomyces sp. 7N604 TaxID=3457415 RepID=UPI003FD3B676